MEEPIRVLHILQRMEAAGVQTFLMNLYRCIDRTKVQFDFLVHYTEKQFFDDEIEKLGGRIYRFSVREDYDFLKYYKELQYFFKQHSEYKIVHGHMHSLGSIYLHVAKINKIPVRIAHSHTNSTQNDWKKYIKILMNRMYAYNANKLYACSRTAGEYMFRNRAFEIINNAIITDKFIFEDKKRKAKRRELNIEDRFVIGCVGRFEKQKNQVFSLAIFEKVLLKVPKAILLFVGTGSMYEEIEELVREKGLFEKVVFLGNRRDVADLYQAMDVFLMPSLFEGLGIVGIEAQASGTPIVCTDSLPEEIDVTPLVHRVSLSKMPEYWAQQVVYASANKLAHCDMKEYIVKANYDMSRIAKEMERFYLEEHINKS